MISTADLANQKFDGITLPEPYGSLLGKIPMNTTGVIWGPKGSGKSTMAVAFAYVLANELGKGIYCSSEEGPGPSMQNKIKRLEAEHEELMVTDFDGLGDLKAAIQYSGSKFCVLDSASMGYVKLAEFEEFHDWCKKQGVILFYILHANKEGRYKGNTMFVHMPDIEIKVSEGIAETEKNRFAETPRSMEVQFNASDTRENPVETPFSISLKDFYNIHKIRSWKRLNSMLGAKTPCYTKKHSGESEHSEFSIRYIPDYHNKKYPVELLIDNKVEYQACTEGESGDFQSSLERLIEDHGDIEVIVHDQDHAKLVLGAKEYKRQEKQREKKIKQETKPKESVSEDKPKTSGIEGDTPATPKEAKVIEQQEEAKKPKWKTGKLLYLTEDHGRHEKGTPVKVRHDYNPNFDNEVKVRCCEGEMVKEAFQLPESKLSETKPKTEPAPEPKTTQDIDTEAVKKSQEKLDKFLDEILA